MYYVLAYTAALVLMVVWNFCAGEVSNSRSQE